VNHDNDTAESGLEETAEHGEHGGELHECEFCSPQPEPIAAASWERTTAEAQGDAVGVKLPTAVAGALA
jgi:hypothetical protein